MISMKLMLRRAIVVMAVALSLAVGGLAVRAASAWTASEAPLAAAPVSVKTLAQQLADEQARSAALEDHLTALTGQSGDLALALKAARDRAAGDAKAAQILQAKLAATKRLAERQAKVKPVTARPAASVHPTKTAAPVAVVRAPTVTPPPVQSTTGASGATPTPGGSDD
jgi:Skp family chaperone for outer membrane proteins